MMLDNRNCWNRIEGLQESRKISKVLSCSAKMLGSEIKCGKKIKRANLLTKVYLANCMLKHCMQ